MKKLCILLLLFCIMASTFSQDSLKTHDYYLERSKRQKSGAKALLIGGGVVCGLGLLIGTGKEASFDQALSGAGLGTVGVLSMIGSIPLFIASSRNKRKANLLISTGNLHPAIPFGNGKKITKLGIAISI